MQAVQNEVVDSRLPPRLSLPYLPFKAQIGQS